MAETLPSCKLPDKPATLRGRMIAAQARLPRNTAHHVLVASRAHESEERRFASDELWHDFAKSRSTCANVAHQYEGEGLLHPLHYPVQRPVDTGRDIANQRVTRYDMISPVSGGVNAARSAWRKF